MVRELTALFLVGPLLNAQRQPVAAAPANRHLLARGHGGAVFQAQVDAHGGCAGRGLALHFYCHVEIPAAPAVLTTPRHE